MSSRHPRRPWTPPTLSAVANYAGVSIPTASRALAGDAAKVRNPPSQSTQIIEAARRLGYRDKTLPRRPRLLVLVSELVRTGYWQTLSGILDAASELGVELSLNIIPGASSDWSSDLAWALTSPVDGVVVLEFDSLGLAIQQHLPLDLPLAIAGGHPNLGQDIATPRSWVDDFAGAVLATEYLIGLGHQRIGYLGVPPAGHPDPRLAGWKSALAKVGFEAIQINAVGWSVGTGRRSASEVIARRFSAVLCGNDDLALGLICGLSEKQIAIPQQISVIGMDDHPHSPAAIPALTTVKLDFSLMGQTAALLALGKYGDDAADTQIRIAPQLVVRDSAGKFGD